MKLEYAKEILNACEKKANQENLKMNIAVVNSQGRLVCFYRMDDAWLGSIDISINKAYTATAFKMPTDVLGELSQPNKPLFGINASNDGKLIIFGGGIPLFYPDNQLAGAVGVSGGSVLEDILVAKEGEKAFNFLINSNEKKVKKDDTFSF